MPFAINRATASISPTKTLEYFAARRPVVSTPVADVVAAYGDIAYVADGPAAFVAAVREALDAPAERIERGFAAAAAPGLGCDLRAHVERGVRVSGEPFDAARALRWLRQLKKNNDRPWFAAHRDVYDDHIKPEWEDLVAGLLVSAASFDERLAHVDPRSCVFRLARDIRFSNDKTPFKTAVTAWLSPGGKSGANAGYYLHVDAGQHLLRLPASTRPRSRCSKRLRLTIAARSAALRRVLQAKRLAPYLPLRNGSVARMPRGFPKEHPHGELIRARNYLVRRAYTDAEIVRAGAFATFRGAMRDCAAFVGYLDGIAGGVSAGAP